MAGVEPAFSAFQAQRITTFPHPEGVGRGKSGFALLNMVLTYELRRGATPTQFAMQHLLKMEEAEARRRGVDVNANAFAIAVCSHHRICTGVFGLRKTFDGNEAQVTLSGELLRGRCVVRHQICVNIPD